MGTNTGIGIGIGIPFKNNALGGDRPYLPPELKARLIGVWDNYGKKNTDADRNIIKNKIPNAGGDLEILNSAYRLNSGFGGYSNDFQEYTYNENVVVKDNTNAIFNKGGQLLVPYSLMTKNISSFKIKVSGLSETYHFRYYYRDNNGVQHSVNMAKDGNYELPICYNVQNSSDGTDCGFANNGSDIITVEILPAFEGALVTDGINDIIASIKTLEEWNIGDKGITIVSMIHQINTKSNNFITTNNIRTDNKVIGRNIVSNIEKTGIYGWYKENIQSDTINVINNILGDKNDYISHSSPSTNINPINNSKFYVQGYAIENGFAELSSVAHYWTFAVLGKATEDEINLIIAKYNLDRTLNPDILCNTIKQGITNENHAEFGDKLIDFSGNGRDIQLNNLAWKGGSGIAAKQYETFKDWTNTPYQTSTVTEIDEFTRVVDSTSNSYWVSMINRTSDFDKVHDSINIVLYQDDMLLVHECKYKIDENVTTKALYETLKSGVNTITLATIDKFTDIPEDAEIMSLGEWVNPKSNKGSVKITLLPSYKGGLLLDGVNDFGKVTGMPIYKDYTVIADREIETINGGVLSKSYVADNGSFIFEQYYSEQDSTSSFGYTKLPIDNLNRDRKISYQSKYSYNGTSLSVGTGIDGSNMWLATIRDNDSRFSNIAIYSLMTFPYSMSEFLIERQLKKHKLGTLYPNMVEFRPVIKANASYDNIVFYYKNEKVENGTYLTVGSSIGMHISLSSSPVNEIKSITVNGIPATFKYHDANNNIYQYDFNLTSKSPQKINITIDEYIRFEDIKQPYPVIFQVKDRHTSQIYNYGDKIKVGSSIQLIHGEKPNLLSGLYSIKSYEYEGKTYSYNQLTNLNIILTKQSISLSCNKIWLLDNNEPNCILSPRLLRIPNSSYKILGHIPDISGHGNHGVIHNSAYAEGSGVNEDGSYQFDGVDDFVTIPTTVGGKQVLMKVNWQSYAGGVTLYDQRLNLSDYEFAIYNGDRDLDDNPIPAYQGRNNGQTYIDGILNNNIKASELRYITHNITITNELSLGTNNTYPVIGSTRWNTHFAQMSLYDFMLFDEISTDDKIKELNEYVGIEGNTE